MSNVRVYETCYKRDPARMTLNIGDKTLRELLIEDYNLKRLKGNVYIPKAPRNDKIMAVKFFNKNKKLANIQQRQINSNIVKVLLYKFEGRAIVYKNRK